jgi:hypothetical protein
MQSKTHTLALAAPKAAVFDFLSRIENLPKWATNFCLGLRGDGGRHRVITPQGEIFFRIEADRATGVIDMYGGPSEAEMAYWPARVVDRLPRGSLFIFTAFQLPGMSEEVFERQCDALLDEFANIRRFTEAA